MAAAALRSQLKAHIDSMLNSGLLDAQFQQLQMIQEEDGTPDLIAGIIDIFFEDAGRIIDELGTLLDNRHCVDFGRVTDFVHQLRGSSGSVGAVRVKNTCVEFYNCCKQKRRDGCLKALDFLRNNFYELQQNFQIMRRLEQQIKACS